MIKIVLGLLLCTIAITGTVSASNLQIKYIDKYEIPQLSECTYYDYYGNIIYENIIEACPELNIITNTQNFLSFTVEENFIGRLTEPLTVENGVGYIYYDANVNVNVQVDITYLGQYVESLTYTVYEIIDHLDSDIKTGFMLKETMVTNYDIDNQVTIIYSTQENEFNMNDVDSFPSFDTIEPVMKEYVSTLTIEEDSSPNDTQIMTFKEIKNDDEGLEVVNTFGIGQYERINAPLISVDFYESTIATGNSTDYYFDYHETTIKNREERRQVAGVDRQYDVRTLTFKQPPLELHGENESLFVDSLMFSAFEADLYYAWAFDYSFEHTINTFGDELFIYDGDFYSKLVFTDYGVRVEEYYLNQFTWDSLFPKETEEGLFDTSLAIIGFNDNRINRLLEAYDYKKMLMTPGYLSNYDFYQHNFLIEHVFIDNYDKFE